MDIGFLSALTPYMNQATFDINEIIYKINEHPSFIYFILDGEIALYINRGVFVRWLKTGSYFGDVELLKNKDRCYNVQALRKTKVLIIDKETFL